MSDLFNAINEYVNLSQQTKSLKDQTKLNTILAATQMEPTQRQMLVDYSPAFRTPEKKFLGFQYGGGEVDPELSKRVMGLPDPATVREQRMFAKYKPLLSGPIRTQLSADPSMTPDRLEGEVDNRIRAILGFQSLGLEKAADRLISGNAVDSIGDIKLKIAQGKASPQEIEWYTQAESLDNAPRQMSPYDIAMQAMIAKHGPEYVGNLLLTQKQLPGMNYEMSQDDKDYELESKARDQKVKSVDQQISVLKARKDIYNQQLNSAFKPSEKKVLKSQIDAIDAQLRLLATQYENVSKETQSASEAYLDKRKQKRASLTVTPVSTTSTTTSVPTGSGLRLSDSFDLPTGLTPADSVGAIPVPQSIAPTPKSGVQGKSWNEVNKKWGPGVDEKTQEELRNLDKSGEEYLPFGDYNTDKKVNSITPDQHKVFANFVRDKVNKIIASIG